MTTGERRERWLSGNFAKLAGAQLVKNSPQMSTYSMALNNLGSLILSLLIFVTTLVNISNALASLEPVLLIVLYALTRIFVTPPEEGMISRCQMGHLYQNA
jgi:ABC-type uncharacterized transport system permease subunit